MSVDRSIVRVPQQPQQGGACGKPPQVFLLEMASGYWRTQITYTLAKLGVADALGTSAATVAELAERLGTPESPLGRLLRAATGLGLLKTDEQGRYALTDIGNCLRSDVPQSVRHIVLMSGAEHYVVWGHLYDAVRTGEPQFEQALGHPQWWRYLDEHPAASRVFDGAMEDLSRNSHLPAIGGYDFGPYTRIVDVGGGTGTVVARILAAHPHLTGVLFDRKEVLEAAGPVLANAGVADRCDLVAGDVFGGVPAGGDCYLLSSMLHDFSDEQALRILEAVRAVIPADGTLLLIESVLPATDAPHTAKLNDLNMLVMVGGRERTADELRALLAGAGFTLADVRPSPTPANVVTARPVAA